MSITAAVAKRNAAPANSAKMDNALARAKATMLARVPASASTSPTTSYTVADATRRVLLIWFATANNANAPMAMSIATETLPTVASLSPPRANARQVQHNNVIPMPKAQQAKAFANTASKRVPFTKTTASTTSIGANAKAL